MGGPHGEVSRTRLESRSEPESGRELQGAGSVRGASGVREGASGVREGGVRGP